MSTPNTRGQREGTVGALELARRGWASPLAVCVTACLLIEAITGLWIYLAPFSIGSQIQVVLHTVAGVVLLLPYAYYQIRHFLKWYRQKLTVVMVLGYALAIVALVCLVSGVVVTWQAAVGPKLTAGWDLVHLVTGIATLPLLVGHVALAYARRSPAAQKSPDFTLAVRGFCGRISWTTLGGAVLVVVGAFAWPEDRVEFDAPEGYSLPAYAQNFDEYRGSLFAPSYARTASGKMVDPDAMAHSESCGTSGCHEQILGEWLPSAHRFAAMNPPFQQVQKNFAADREPAETRYCAGCHDPISLFAGAKDIHNQDLTAPGMQEGNSCIACHCISEVDERGNADYVFTPPQKYAFENTEGWRKFVSDFLIRAYPRQHLADYDRNVLRSAEFCGACHKQFIPEALNRFGVSPGQNQYDEWRKSHWHDEDHPESDLSCRDCHMRLVTSDDPGRGEAGDVRRTADDRAHRHHGMIATNFLMPEVLKLPNWEKHVAETLEWMRGETVLPEIAELWPKGPVASLQLITPKSVRPGEETTVRVTVTNRKVGHNFTTGPLDFVRAWVHMRVLDRAGKTIFEWGEIDPVTRRINDRPGEEHEVGNSRRQGTMVFEGEPQDEHGNPLVKHELWKKAGGKGQRVIFPRYSDTHTYKFKVPKDVTGELTIKADLNFRRYRQEFLDLVVPDMEKMTGVRQRTVTQTSAQKRISIAGQ
jgi:Cytochrome c554 and c-prime